MQCQPAPKWLSAELSTITVPRTCILYYFCMDPCAMEYVTSNLSECDLHWGLPDATGYPVMSRKDPEAPRTLRRGSLFHRFIDRDQ